ncbi:hypothetical protein DFH06DRAFT_1325917 [Mycena polygramma]|nr:hypothetical protein DFH06DRAFT_1325917 [Mycena polygramma]
MVVRDQEPARLPRWLYTNAPRRARQTQTRSPLAPRCSLVPRRVAAQPSPPRRGRRASRTLAYRFTRVSSAANAYTSSNPSSQSSQSWQNSGSENDAVAQPPPPSASAIRLVLFSSASRADEERQGADATVDKRRIGSISAPVVRESGADSLRARGVRGASEDCDCEGDARRRRARLALLVHLPFLCPLYLLVLSRGIVMLTCRSSPALDPMEFFAVYRREYHTGPLVYCDAGVRGACIFPLHFAIGVTGDGASVSGLYKMWGCQGASCALSLFPHRPLSVLSLAPPPPPSLVPSSLPFLVPHTLTSALQIIAFISPYFRAVHDVLDFDLTITSTTISTLPSDDGHYPASSIDALAGADPGAAAPVEGIAPRGAVGAESHARGVAPGRAAVLELGILASVKGLTRTADLGSLDDGSLEGCGSWLTLCARPASVRLRSCGGRMERSSSDLSPGACRLALHMIVVAAIAECRARCPAPLSRYRDTTSLLCPLFLPGSFVHFCQDARRVGGLTMLVDFLLVEVLAATIDCSAVYRRDVGDMMMQGNRYDTMRADALVYWRRVLKRDGCGVREIVHPHHSLPCATILPPRTWWAQAFRGSTRLPGLFKLTHGILINTRSRYQFQVEDLCLRPLSRLRWRVKKEIGFPFLDTGFLDFGPCEGEGEWRAAGAHAISGGNVVDTMKVGRHRISEGVLVEVARGAWGVPLLSSFSSSRHLSTMRQQRAAIGNTWSIASDSGVAVCALGGNGPRARWRWCLEPEAEHAYAHSCSSTRLRSCGAPMWMSDSGGTLAARQYPISALFWMPSYALRIHSCEEVVWSRRKAPNLYVVVYQDGRAVHRTNAVKRNRTPEWNDLCNLSSDSPITLRLWHDYLLRCRDICLGAVDTEISALLNPASSDTEYIRLPLTSEDRGSGKHTGTVLVCLVRNGAAASIAIEQSKQNIGQLAHVSALIEAAGMVDSSQPAVQTFEAGLGIIITKLDMIIQIGNEVAKIHPYANMAWKVLTSVYQAVKAEQETQEKLKKLVDIMVSVYSFTEETDALPQKIKSLEDKVLAIIKQTVECAVFIREYSGHGFTARVMKNTWDNADKTIDDLSETLLKLKDSLDGTLIVQGLFLSAQVLQKVDRLGM